MPRTLSYRPGDTEVVYVRIPAALKTELVALAEEYNASLAFVVSRAVECYLSDRCGFTIVDRSPLP